MNSRSSVLIALICLGAGVVIGLGWPRGSEEKRVADAKAATVVMRTNFVVAGNAAGTTKRVPARIGRVAQGLPELTGKRTLVVRDSAWRRVQERAA